jgi:hypothetical protein
MPDAENTSSEAVETPDPPIRDIPWYFFSWKRVGRASWSFTKDFYTTYRDQRGSMLAASIAYFVLLSAIPFILIVAMVLSWIYGSESAARQTILDNFKDIPQIQDTISGSFAYSHTSPITPFLSPLSRSSGCCGPPRTPCSP